MTRFQLFLGKWPLLGAVLLLLALMPGKIHASGVGFQNRLQMPVLIQGASNINGMIRRGQPIVLLPGRTGIDPNVPSGLRQISVYDATQPSQLLLRQVVPVPVNQNLYFSIQPNNGPGPYPVTLVPHAPPQ